MKNYKDGRVKQRIIETIIQINRTHTLLVVHCYISDLQEQESPGIVYSSKDPETAVDPLDMKL